MTHSQPTPQNDMPAIATPGDLAAALGRIPSGLFVVTWRAEGGDRGMLASWVMQAGFDPPLVTVAVAPSRGLFKAVESGSPFVVNVLAENQRPLLARFGKPAAAGENPFEGLAIGRSGCGAATIEGAAAWLECIPLPSPTAGAALSGDHAIVVARVESASAAADLAPLVHLRKNGLRY